MQSSACVTILPAAAKIVCLRYDLQVNLIAAGDRYERSGVALQLARTGCLLVPYRPLASRGVLLRVLTAEFGCS